MKKIQEQIIEPENEGENGVIASPPGGKVSPQGGEVLELPTRNPNVNSLKLSDVVVMKPLFSGSTDDLLIEYETLTSHKRRVWLSRMTIQNGQPYNNMITIEEYQLLPPYKRSIKHAGYSWITIKQYEAK